MAENTYKNTVNAKGGTIIPLNGSYPRMKENPATNWNPAIFSQFPRVSKDEYKGWTDPNFMGYSMRTDEYRYTKWIDFKTKETVATELYNHRKIMKSCITLPENQNMLPLKKL